MFTTLVILCTKKKTKKFRAASVRFSHLPGRDVCRSRYRHSSDRPDRSAVVPRGKGAAAQRGASIGLSGDGNRRAAEPRVDSGRDRTERKMVSGKVPSAAERLCGCPRHTKTVEGRDSVRWWPFVSRQSPRPRSKTSCCVCGSQS